MQNNLSFKFIAFLLVLLSIIPYIYLVKKFLIKKFINFTKNSRYYLFLEKNKVFSHIFYLMINIYLLFFNSIICSILPMNIVIFRIKDIILTLYTVANSILLSNSLANVVGDLNKNKKNVRTIIIPIQIFKISTYFVSTSIIVHYIFHVSLISLITSLGLTTALFIVVFKENILGLIASTQMTLTDTIRIGDHVILEVLKIEGKIKNINISTTEILNIDGSISTIPSHNLMFSCLKNFRFIEQKQYRVIKIKIFFELKSIKYCNLDFINDLVVKFNHLNIIKKDLIGVISNLTLLKKYIISYLLDKYFDRIQKKISIINLEQNAMNIPIEITCKFSSISLEEYDQIQSDIMEHVIINAKHFDLSVGKS